MVLEGGATSLLDVVQELVARATTMARCLLAGNMSGDAGSADMDVVGGRVVGGRGLVPLSSAGRDGPGQPSRQADV